MSSPTGPDQLIFLWVTMKKNMFEFDHDRLVNFCDFLWLLNDQNPNSNSNIEEAHIKHLPFLDVVDTRSDILSKLQ